LSHVFWLTSLFLPIFIWTDLWKLSKIDLIKG
jgi:hypothetical protein